MKGRIGALTGLDDLARASDALYSIPPDLARDEWVRAGMAYHAAGGDFETWDDWSSKAGNYKAGDCRDAWRTFKGGKGVGAGTLYYMATALGGRGKGDKPQRTAPALVRQTEQPRKPAPASGMGVDEVYSRLELATTGHAYIMEKRAAGVPLAALRVVSAGDGLTIQGERMAGALVVPVIRPDGSFSSLQFITLPDVAARLKAKGKPSKLNLPKCSVQGWFTVGELVPGGVAYIVEGIGQGWACWQATGAAAVVAFGAGNMGKVAKALREQDPNARLVVVPDVGKETDALKIAAEVGAAVAVMPVGEVNNFDANDFMQREGGDALALLLEAVTEPSKPDPMVHPLARFVDFDGTAKPPRWVIPGFIGHGVTVIAGAHGVGKTTALLPLALTAAGLHGDALMPCQWRHVVYVTEDVEQARRILAGIVGYSNLGINLESIRERVHLVEAVRLDPAFVASVGKTYREKFTRNVDGVEVLPLVVLDTKSAVLAIDNENDNSEASKIMAALKQGFDCLPVWLIGHVAKANLTRNEALTSRGASAVEGDANQTMFLIREGERRYLVQGKTRFEARWHELEIKSHIAHTLQPDEFGNLESVDMRWGIAEPAQKSRKESAEQTAVQQRKADEASLRQAIRDAVDMAFLSGNPLNRAGLKAKLNRNSTVVGVTIENLLNERWLHEIVVPAKVRTNNKRAAFFVNLTTVEHDAVMSGAELPADKLVIPDSWKNVPVPFVPASESESFEVAREAQ
jgi:hypothetical protein